MVCFAILKSSIKTHLIELFWELVQNACDLTTQCKIEIDCRDNKFSFSYNRKVLTINDLTTSTNLL